MAILFAALAASMAAPDKPSSAIRLPSVPLPEASSPIIKVAPAPDRHRPSGPVAPPMEIKSEDLRIAPAPSVLAATLGYLRAVPSAPIHQRLTCVVDAHNGTPLNCFPAEIVGTPLTWQQFFVRTDSYLAKPASGNQAEEDAQRLLTAATDRVLNSRVRRDPSVPDTDSARLMTFNIALSAADAHPAPAFQDPLRFGDIRLETPIAGPFPTSCDDQSVCGTRNDNMSNRNEPQTLLRRVGECRAAFSQADRALARSLFHLGFISGRIERHRGTQRGRWQRCYR